MTDVSKLQDEFKTVDAPKLPGSQQEVAEQAFKSAVTPLREDFGERVTGEVESLAKRGIQFGGVGGERLRDVFKEQQRIEGNIAGQIGSQLGQTALDQAFRSSEAAKSRTLQKELQETGFQFSSEEAEKGREFASEEALLGRTFSSEEAAKEKVFQTAFLENQQEFASSQADIDRQDAKNQQAISLALSGNLEGQSVTDVIRETFGEGTKLTTQDEADLQRIAVATGLTPDEYIQMRKAIGQGQLADILERPEDYIESPERTRQFQTELAKLQSETQVQVAKEESKGKVLCTELYRQKLLPRRIFVADQRHASKMDIKIQVGYHFWAKPLVKVMARSKIVTYMLYPVISAWAYHMAYLEGVEKKDNLFGRALAFIGVPICGLIGTVLRKERGVIAYG